MANAHFSYLESKLRAGVWSRSEAEREIDRAVMDGRISIAQGLALMQQAAKLGSVTAIDRDRLVLWIDSHSSDGKPLVLGFTTSRKQRLIVRSAWYKRDTNEAGETLEIIDATLAAAREWLGY